MSCLNFLLLTDVDETGSPADRKLMNKHVNAQKEQILKDFLRGSLSVKNKCPHCGVRVRPLRAEYNSKIYFAKGVTKAAAVEMLRKRQQRIKDDNMRKHIEGYITLSSLLAHTCRKTDV